MIPIGHGQVNFRDADGQQALSTAKAWRFSMNEIMMAMPWPSCTMEVEHDASPWKNRSLLRQSRCTVQLGGGVGANFTVKPSQPMYILYSFTLSLVLKRSVNLFGTSSCKTSFRVFVSSCLLLCFFCFASCLLGSTRIRCQGAAHWAPSAKKQSQASEAYEARVPKWRDPIPTGLGMFRSAFRIQKWLPMDSIFYVY